MTPSPTGLARVFTLAGMSCTVLVYGVAKGRGPIPARTSVYHTPHIEIKNAPPGRFHHSCGAERPNCNRPRSGHLSGRVAPPTRVGEAGGSRNLTGAPPPQAPFFGAPPRFFGQDQRNGVEQQHQPKVQQDKSASSAQPKPTPGRGWNPAPTGRAARRDLQQKNARRVARVWLRGGDLNPLTFGL